MQEKIYNELSKIIDPELGFDIVALGLIYGVKVDNDKAIITITLSAKSCPLHDLILNWVKEAGEKIVGSGNCEIDLVWEPEWSIEMANSEVRAKLG